MCLQLSCQLSCAILEQTSDYDRYFDARRLRCLIQASTLTHDQCRLQPLQARVADAISGVQWSTVCRTLALGVEGLLFNAEFSLCSPPELGCKPLRFDTRLMLHWAPLLRSLQLSGSPEQGGNGWPLENTSLKDFVAAAATLREVYARSVAGSCLALGPILRQAAAIDDVLCASKSVQMLCCSGRDRVDLYVPSRLPQQLEDVQVSWKVLASQLPHAQAQSRFDEMMGSMSSMSQLRVLNMDCHNLSLTSMAHLPRLAELTLQLRVGPTTAIDLSWLRDRSFDELLLCLHLPACTAERSRQVVAELQQVQVSDLRLLVNKFPLELQQIWCSYKGCDKFLLHFQHRPEVVCALPPCKQITISCRPIFQRGLPLPLVINWQALARAGRFHVSVPSGARGGGTVQVQGHALLPDSMDPWQLVVSASKVEGLPALELTSMPAMHWVQNAAADAVGWQSTCFHACLCSDPAI